MFLRCTQRKKNGKQHRYWSIVENRRLPNGRVAQRHVLYLGEISDSQELAWAKSIQAFQDGHTQPQMLTLFPEDRVGDAVDDASLVRLRLSELSVHRPRQWGACWLALLLWRELGLDQFWAQRLPASRKGTRWDLVLTVLAIYRLVAPGSEWRLHRQWFESTALADLLGTDLSLSEAHRLYRCHDYLLAHKAALFTHLIQRWRDLFNAQFDVLLYDLTSTYFESDPPFPEGDKRRFGYSRDKRPDCVQVVIALIVTVEGLPLAYEVLSGNTRDSTTLRDFLKKIESQYGKARRTWIMDRGVPTEEVLAEMRACEPAVQYLVGTPKGRLTKLEKDLLDKPWQEVRPGVTVKLLACEGEVYILARSEDRAGKERGMRRRQLKWLWRRLKELQAMDLKREALLMKLGAAHQQAPRAWRLVRIDIHPTEASFAYQLLKDKLRQVRRREGRYLLRTNLTETDPSVVWAYYMQLVTVEQAFRNLKGDLAVRPIFHQEEPRIEAHIFVSFLAYCLHVTLGRKLWSLAPGLTPRSALEKLAGIQRVDVQIPTSDGRMVLLQRTTQPEADVRLLLERLKLDLPAQPLPRITQKAGQIEAIL
jgi:transposase